TFNGQINGLKPGTTYYVAVRIAQMGCAAGDATRPLMNLNVLSFTTDGTAGPSGAPAASNGPTVNLSSPTDGATFSTGQKVQAAYTCADASGAPLLDCIGVDSLHGTVAPGSDLPTDVAGLHQFTVTATDGQGVKT